MRSFGISLVILSIVAVALRAQPPVVPGPPPSASTESILDGHLAGWEKAMKDAKSFSVKFELTRTDAVFKKERKYTGSAICMKPNMVRLSSKNTKDENDFEAYIYNGKSIWHYDWAGKTVTEIPVPADGGDNLMFDFLNGMTAAAAKKRFQIAQLKPNAENYVYLDIKPTLPKDKQEFESILLALYAPKVPAPYVPYLPAQILLQKPNGDSEKWTFSDQALNAKEVVAEAFQYKEPEGKWQIRKLQGPLPFGNPPLMPGGKGLPPGPGAVKP